MEGLTRLRSWVYARDKHDAGWGACSSIEVAYVLGHVCLLPRADRHQGPRLCYSRRGGNVGNGDGHGYDNGRGAYGGRYNHDAGNGGGNSLGGGSGRGNGKGASAGCDFGFGFGDGYGNGRGNNHICGDCDVHGDELWKI